MNQRDTVTQLTVSGIKTLQEEGQGKGNIIVQIIDNSVIVTNKGEGKSLKYKVTVSDGYASQKGVLGNDAALAFESAGAPNFSVIRILENLTTSAAKKYFKELENNGSRLLLITKMDIVYSNINEQIGWPIDFVEYQSKPQNYINNQGSNQIPAKYLPSIKPQPNNMQYGNAGMNNQRNQPAQSRPQPQTLNNPVNGQRNNENFPPNPQQKMQQQQTFGNNNNQQPKRANSSNGPISYVNQSVINVSEEEFMSFKQLVPFADFTIKARVTNKSQIRTFKNGERSLFSVDLMDKEGNELQATFFGESVDAFYPVLQENKVYVMMNGTVKMANPKFQRTNCDYCIVFDKPTAYIKEFEDKGDIDQVKLNYVPISEAIQAEPNATVDVLCFVKDPGSCNTMIIKSGDSKERRVVQVYDDSNQIIELTLWGEVAQSFSAKTDDLIAIKSARVSEFNGKKNLSNGFSTKLFVDLKQVPKNDRIIYLTNWRKNDFDPSALQTAFVDGAGGGKYAFYTLEEINQDAQNVDEKGLYKTRAHITHLRTDGNLYYAACNNEKCGRKLVEKADGSFFNLLYFKAHGNVPIAMYTLSVKITDSTSSLFVSAFDKVGQQIINKDARSIKDMKENGNDGEVGDLFKEATNKEYLLRILAKPDNYGQERRIRHQIIGIGPINFVEESNALLKDLEEYAAMNPMMN